jgi:hypothetical protein
MFQGSQNKSDCRFIIYGFTSRSRIHLLSIAGEGLQNLGLCSALKAFEQGGITCGFLVSSEEQSHSVASCDTQGYVEDLF